MTFLEQNIHIRACSYREHFSARIPLYLNSTAWNRGRSECYLGGEKIASLTAGHAGEWKDEAVKAA